LAHKAAQRKSFPEIFKSTKFPTSPWAGLLEAFGLRRVMRCDSINQKCANGRFSGWTDEAQTPHAPPSAGRGDAATGFLRFDSRA
jgi:hypothetical protein